MQKPRVMIIGAGGFVGRHLCASLDDRKWRIVGASRQRREDEAHMQWRQLDLEAPASLRGALDGIDRVVYLAHSMGQGGDFAAREAQAVTHFIQAARASAISRVVFLGGVAPRGVHPSKHLESRLATGQRLRDACSTIELRAGMVVGAGSQSLRLVRDLAVRVPIWLVPPWGRFRSQPIAIADICHAIEAALCAPPEVQGWFEVPGPQELSLLEMLEAVSRVRNSARLHLPLPLSTHTAGLWARLTRVDPKVAFELAQGLNADLIAWGPSFWDQIPPHQRLSYEQALRQALALEEAELSRPVRWLESGLDIVGKGAAYCLESTR